MSARRIIRFRARPFIAVLRALESAGARRPSIAVGEYRVGLGTVLGRAYAKRRGVYLGELRPSGSFRPSEAATPSDLKSLRAIVENTLDVARGSAILLGLKARCAACGRLLDSKDKLRGIGAGCYRRGEFERLEKGYTAVDRKSSKIKYERSEEWPYAKRKTTKTRRR